MIGLSVISLREELAISKAQTAIPSQNVKKAQGESTAAVPNIRSADEGAFDAAEGVFKRSESRECGTTPSMPKEEIY